MSALYAQLTAKLVALDPTRSEWSPVGLLPGPPGDDPLPRRQKAGAVMIPYYRDGDDPFEFRHMHACPCGTTYTCYLMACRERPAEPCLPCQLREESVLRRRARAAIAKAREWIRSSKSRMG